MPDRLYCRSGEEVSDTATLIKAATVTDIRSIFLSKGKTAVTEVPRL